MRKKHFSRAWKKLVRSIPELFYRVPMFKPQKSEGGNRAQMRRLMFSSQNPRTRRNPLRRQTKQMRRGEG